MWYLLILTVLSVMSVGCGSSPEQIVIEKIETVPCPPEALERVCDGVNLDEVRWNDLEDVIILCRKEIDLWHSTHEECVKELGND